MTTRTFTLDECPNPYPPWIAGAKLPEIFLTIPLEAGEDLTGATIQMFLTRDTTDPDNPDVLEKTLVELSNTASQQLSTKVSWVATDLIEGAGQDAVFVLITTLGDRELIGRFTIDVIANPDPTP